MKMDEFPVKRIKTDHESHQFDCSHGVAGWQPNSDSAQSTTPSPWQPGTTTSPQSTFSFPTQGTAPWPSHSTGESTPSWQLQNLQNSSNHGASPPEQSTFLQTSLQRSTPAWDHLQGSQSTSPWQQQTSPWQPTYSQSAASWQPQSGSWASAGSQSTSPWSLQGSQTVLPWQTHRSTGASPWQSSPLSSSWQSHDQLLWQQQNPHHNSQEWQPGASQLLPRQPWEHPTWGAATNSCLGTNWDMQAAYGSPMAQRTDYFHPFKHEPMPMYPCPTGYNSMDLKPYAGAVDNYNSGASFTLGPMFLHGTIAERFLQLELALVNALQKLEYPDTVTHVYNPVDYAREPHWCFLEKYCKTQKDVLFLGMNPGPFGMAQSGVPFGEVNYARDWLGITGEVRKPAKEHPKKQVWGLDCPRREVSGARFWGYFQKLCSTPDNFFSSCFVHNICPLIYMNETGKNITPPDMKVCYRHPLIEACDRGLCDTIRLLRPKLIIGVGKFAEHRARVALKAGQIHGVEVGVIMHPSPANPTANRGWETIVHKQLIEMDFTRFLPKFNEIKPEMLDKTPAPLPSPKPVEKAPENAVKEEPKDEPADDHNVNNKDANEQVNNLETNQTDSTPAVAAAAPDVNNGTENTPCTTTTVSTTPATTTSS